MHIQNNNLARTEAPSENRNEINDSDVADILEAVAPSEARLFTPSDSDQGTEQPLDRTGPITKRSSRLSPCSRKPARLIPTVIVDNSPLFRAGLRHILSGGRFRVLADCSAPRDLPERAFDLGECLVLVGLDKDHSDVAVVSQISALMSNREGLHIVVLGDRCRSEQWFHTIKAGASGYLIKEEVTGEALLQSLELVWLGVVVIPQGLIRTISHVQDTGPVCPPSIETAFSVRSRSRRRRNFLIPQDCRVVKRQS
jgi:DNA-binding NarL/FixJ family response regulator